ncbi:choice-of-anchor D domain-containing protein [Bdellovibrio svalbardensis]|uniref:Choice-of-anchor D domain-containing protein n=1 Tax=Bdellovibrio svalbardensis TaxID=2972972 RepID=A0ABT6DJX7_9BACT|nr:choice-of-anchor D domain-containing protein [Bdellovibrio svalbardensis]MDG0816229.1 choice-of-anchor D domain-containing protein [Bdellovibrio svalbardensis]
MKTWLMALTGSLISCFVSVSSIAAETQPTESQLTITVANSVENVQTLGNSDHHGGNQYYNYNFGITRVNTSQYARFTLRSTGNQPLLIDSVRLYGSAFYGNSNCPRVLNPGRTCDAWIEFRPWYEGSYSGQLVFATSAGNFIVRLYGWGNRY